MTEIKRMPNNFPVFASQSRYGEMKDLDGKTHSDSFYENINLTAFKKGLLGNVESSECKDKLKNITPEVLNTIFNVITHGLEYLYNKGIPEYSSLVTYSLNSVVTFNGNLYISRTNNNTHVPIDNSYWKAIKFDSTETNVVKDTNPIGTILTVPKNTNLAGYIEYKTGESFNEILYPELRNVLGTNVFGSIGSSDTAGLPIGTIVYSLNTEVIPSGFISWNSPKGILGAYPELLRVLTRLVDSLPVGESKLAWNKALQTHSLPNFGDIFFKLSNGFNVGEFTAANSGINYLNTLPVIIDSSHSLNPVGITRQLAEKEMQSVITNGIVEESNTKTPFVITGQRSEVYGKTEVNLFKIKTDTEELPTQPANISVNVLIKATNNVNPHIPVTHKQIIKALNN